MNVDIEKAKEVFKKYIEKYDIANPRIKIKAEHIFRVADNSKKIAKSLNLDEENTKLAELIGLLHDIGRFEQVRRYNTFADRMSEDHADLGIKILKENNFIREFIEDDKYDEIIIKAIKNHNKYRIQDQLEGTELLHAQIIRDADKLDIFNIIIGSELKDAVWFKSEDMSKEILNEKMYTNFLEGKPVLYEDMKNCVDQTVTWVAYIYDLFFKISLETVKEKDYINRLINRIDYKDNLTKKRMEEIRKIANEYIDNKINE